MKRIVSVLLVMALILNSFPVYAASNLDRLKSITEKIGGAASDFSEDAANKVGSIKDGAGRAKDAAVEGANKAKDGVVEGVSKAKDGAVEGAGKAKM